MMLDAVFFSEKGTKMKEEMKNMEYVGVCWSHVMKYYGIYWHILSMYEESTRAKSAFFMLE